MPAVRCRTPGGGETVLRLEHQTEHPLHIVHDGDEIGVEVAKHGGHHGLGYLGVNVAGTRPQQQALGRVEDVG